MAHHRLSLTGTFVVWLLVMTGIAVCLCTQ